MKKLIVLAALIVPAAFAQTQPADQSKVAELLNNPPPQTTTLDGVVISSASGGDARLEPLPGSSSMTYAFVTMLMFLNFQDQHADMRITDSRPVLHLKIGVNPKGRVYLVRLESNADDNNRSLKMGHSGFGSMGNLTVPDTKWSIPSTVTQESAGIWKLVPDADLAPGEYGIFMATTSGSTQVPVSGDIYGFGIDK